MPSPLSFSDRSALATLVSDVARGADRAVELHHTDAGWEITYLDEGEFNGFVQKGTGPTLAAAIAALKEV